MNPDTLMKPESPWSAFIRRPHLTQAEHADPNRESIVPYRLRCQAVFPGYASSGPGLGLEKAILRGLETCVIFANTPRICRSVPYPARVQSVLIGSGDLSFSI